ncbi:MAG: 6-phosphofructokinase [Candidatus Kryptoniota bacterium]
MIKFKRIGVFTSGGDAPGMNAAIRAIVRTAFYRKVEVIGIQHGYNGMIKGDFQPMGPRSVSNIIQRGGTILKTARSSEFRTPEGRAKAAANLRANGIDGLVAIGGNGTFQGATLLYEEQGIPTVGVPGTIDNDLYGTDYTIGYDTAINTAVEAIDKIRDTADAHDRVFYVEVMGRDSGFIALDVGISTGAEYIAIPETEANFELIRKKLTAGGRQRSSIIVIAEGCFQGGAMDLAKRMSQFVNLEYRVTVLGHIQRGGAPTARDRVLASKLGAAAVDALLRGEGNVMAGEVNGKVVLVPMRETWEKRKGIDNDLLILEQMLSV